MYTIAFLLRLGRLVSRFPKWIARLLDPTSYRRLAGYEAALTPDGWTKYNYIGEVKERVYHYDEDGEEVGHDHTISWTATKEIMKMIRETAERSAKAR